MSGVSVSFRRLNMVLCGRDNFASFAVGTIMRKVIFYEIGVIFPGAADAFHLLGLCFGCVDGGKVLDGLAKLLPSFQRFFLTYLCRHIHLYIIAPDFGRNLFRNKYILVAVGHFQEVHCQFLVYLGASYQPVIIGSEYLYNGCGIGTFIYFSMLAASFAISSAVISPLSSLSSAFLIIFATSSLRVMDLAVRSASQPPSLTHLFTVTRETPTFSATSFCVSPFK